MGRCWCLCTVKSLFLLLLISSAVPLAYLVSLELSAGHVYFYHSLGWIRDCAKWDPDHRRFLISSFSGGVSAVTVPDDDDGSGDAVLREVPLVGGEDFAGNASLGLVIDRPRNRLLVVAADVIGCRFGGLLAYDLSTWQRLFFAHLSGPNDEKSLADDVAVDHEGNAYVTDAKGSKIWKVGPGGEFVSVIESPLFAAKEWYKNLVGLNGIVHHPDGFLLVIHTLSGSLFKVDWTKGDGPVVGPVEVDGGPLRFADGLELLSPTELVVAGHPYPSARLVKSSDGWARAAVVGTFSGPKHRFATAATVKDGKVYINHMVGMGFPKRKHAIVQAVF